MDKVRPLKVTNSEIIFRTIYLKTTTVSLLYSKVAAIAERSLGEDARLHECKFDYEELPTKTFGLKF